MGSALGQGDVLQGGHSNPLQGLPVPWTEEPGAGL